MKINVGSTNPAKIDAAKVAFSKYFKKIVVLGTNADSKISKMPLTEAKTLEGAINRAKDSIKDAEFGVGMEGGVEDSSVGMFCFGYVAIINKIGTIGIGSTGKFLLPPKIRKEIKNGRELSSVMDDFTKKENIREKEGAVGIFTKNIISRADFLERATIFALVKFINKKEFEKK
jgi:inosine/xanthosine triphosphatase